MSALAITTPVRTAPRAPRPDCSRPRAATYQARTIRPASCQVALGSASEPIVHVTRRGMFVAMGTIGLVMGSAAFTIVASFLSVSNGPL